MGLEKWGRALAGFGAGMQGQGGQFLQQLQESDARANAQKLGADLAAGNIDQAQYLKGLAATNPEIYSKLALSQMGVDQPASVKEWLFRENQIPADRKDEYTNFRRNPQWLNTGGAFVNPNNGGNIPITPSPSEMPAFKKEQARAESEGKVEGSGDITPREKKEGGQETVSTIINKMRNDYNTLNKMNSMVSTKRGALENLSIASRTSPLGQFFGAKTGTEEQTIRDNIKNSIPRLMTSIKNSTGMSAQEINSIPEMQLLKDSVTNPNQSIETVTDTLAQLEKLYAGSKVTSKTNEDLYNTDKLTGAEKAVDALEKNKPTTKIIGDKTYTFKNGKWYE